MEIESNKYYTVQEVAEILNISSRKVCDMIRAGEIPAAVGNSAETWRVLGSTLLNLGKSETEVTLPGDPALSEEERQAAQKANVARWRREQAEAEAAEAEANLKRDAANFRISPEEYLERLRKLKEREKKLDEREANFENEVAEQVRKEREEAALAIEQSRAVGTENRNLRLKVENYEAEIKRLKQLLNNQEKITVKRLDDIANFKENINEAIVLIGKMYNTIQKIDESGKSFCKIIRKDLNFLYDNNDDPENWNECYSEALAAVKRINHNMIRLAEVYQDTRNSNKTGIDYDRVFHYLCDRSVRLEKLLRLEDNEQEPEMPLR